MGVEEVLDDPGVHGNISITFPGYSHTSYLRVVIVFARGVCGEGGGVRWGGNSSPFSSSLSY